MYISMHIMPWISLKCYNCFENQVCTLSLKIQFIQQWTQKRKKKWCISKINKTTLQWCLISLRNQQPELSQANTYTYTHTQNEPKLHTSIAFQSNKMENKDPALQGNL